MARFVLVRHGWVDWSEVNDRGWEGPLVDLAPLSPAGTRRVESAVPRLAGLRPELVVSSPLTRALQSASILGDGLGVPLRVEVDLREWVSDTVRGWSASRHRAALEAFLRYDGRPPQDKAVSWEPLAAVRARVRRALAKYSGMDTVVVVTHNLVIFALTGLDLPPGGIVLWDAEGDPHEPARLPVSPVEDSWLAAHARGGRSATVLPRVYELPGPVDVPALERALTELVRRHDALRNRFRRGRHPTREHLPLGEVACAVTFREDVEGDEERLVALARSWATQPLDSYGWPLVRARLLQGDPAYLAITMDRLVVDPWSASIVESELMVIYEAERTGDRLSLPAVPTTADTQWSTNAPGFQAPAASSLVVRPIAGPLLDATATESFESRCRERSVDLPTALFVAASGAAARPVDVLAFHPGRTEADSRTIGWFARPSSCRVDIPPPLDLDIALRFAATANRSVDGLPRLVLSYLDQRGHAPQVANTWRLLDAPDAIGDVDVRFVRTATGVQVYCAAADFDRFCWSFTATVRAWAT